MLEGFAAGYFFFVFIRLYTTAVFFFPPLQVLQAMGYPTGFDSDLDPMSSDEKSDGEGKSETSSHSSNNPTHSTDSSNTLEVGVVCPTSFCFFF